MNEAFMREAIALSIEKMEAGEGGPFGAVIAKGGQVVGRGWNCVTSTNDPTAHAEIMAIRDACQKLKTFHLAGCEIYASCEPCPMCLAAIYWARLDALWFAATRADAGDAGFDDELIYNDLSKPWKNRALPAGQGLQNEARQAFDLWKAKPDRTNY
jgi:tRNA(Arg) A34 adenosine deaminase TadA